MGKYPIFQSPLLDAVEKNMRPCGLSHSFLGSDSRKLSQILEDDQHTVNALGLTHEAIAGVLQELTDKGREGWGDPVKIDDIFEVEVHEVRGTIACPWGHPGLYRKSHVRLINTETARTLAWSDLGIHLIAAHGFYQGRGSPYRLDPAAVKEILRL